MSYPLYAHYYSASDVNIYLYYPRSDKKVHLDKAIGVGFTHTMSKAPIYTLGNSDPTFFSRGNSLVQGSLDIAFMSTNYLKNTINYLLDTTNLTQRKNDLEAKFLNKSSGTKLTEQEVRQLYELQTSILPSMEDSSISGSFGSFEIHIEFDNTNATTDGKYYMMKLQGIEFSGEMMSVHTGEESALVDRYTFLGKNKS